MGELLQLRLGEIAMTAPLAAGAVVLLVFGLAIARRFRRTPPRRITSRGRSLRTDLTYLLVSPISEAGSRILTTLGLAGCVLLAGRELGPEAVQGFGPVIRQPRWLIFLEMLLLADFMFYWTHRWAHTVPWLWRLHAIHHSSEHMRATSAVRAHPAEAWVNLSHLVPLYFLGFPVDMLAPIVPFALMYAFFIHSNVNVPMRSLRYVLNSPAFHRWHHALDVSNGTKNYAAWFPVLDVIFGTYYLPEHPPEALGVEEPVPETFTGQLAYPFRRRTERSPAWNSQTAPTS